MATIASLSGRSVGTSFIEWTARSMPPDNSVSSISLTNSPFPPTLASGTSRIMSPVVLILVISTFLPVLLSISNWMNSACHKASLLPRLPRRITWFVLPNPPSS